MIRTFKLFLLVILVATMTSVTASAAPWHNERTAKTTQPSGPAQDAPGKTGFLTGPNQEDPLDIALDYIHSNRKDLGLSAADLTDILVTDQYVSVHSGVTHIYMRQRFQGLEVFNGNININIARDGSVINLGNSFVPNLRAAINRQAPGRTARQAVDAAAQHLGLKLNRPLQVVNQRGGPAREVVFEKAGISIEPIPAKLVYQPVAPGDVRLAWNVEIYELGAEHYWSLRVDAASGEILSQVDYVVHDTWGAPDVEAATAPDLKNASSVQGAQSAQTVSSGSYNVFALPIESPNHGSRTLEVNPADPIASPYGWHDTDGAPGAEYTISRGNNVYAYLDTDANNLPDPGQDPEGGSTLNFDFPLNLTQQPNTYQDAALANLFYWNNMIHDVFYGYGFDEASGNFQENNYGNGGAGGDAVNAEAQDGSGVNNANFFFPSDGVNPRMQMFLWTFTSPQRDSDLDNGIIVHEYGHGISNRLTGGPSTTFCLFNAEQMGEGWSDYLALMLTMEPGDQGADRRGMGTYVLGQPTSGPGIRAYPYSTNMSIDPRTYDDIKTSPVPHGVGSVWTAMLWDVTWALIDKHGFDPDLFRGTGGNNMALQLVIDGMKLQPCSPGFVNGRDALLQADQINYGGANQCLIWEAFAKRGLGYSANQGSSSTNTDGTEAFDLPPACLVTGDPPLAADDVASTAEDTTVAIDATANDSDPDGNLDPTTAVVTSPTTNGTVTNNGDGSFTYTPDPDFNGQDSFTYEVCDTEGLCDTATVTITVNPVNDPPVANADTANTDEDTPILIDLQGNDSAGPADEDQTLITVAISDPANGTATINPDGTVTYAPDLNFFGTDAFAYVVCDSGGLCGTATVTITVNPVNDPPVVVVSPDSQTVQYSDGITPVTITADDVDSAGDVLVASTSWDKSGGGFTAGLPPFLVLSGPTNNGSTTPGNASWTLSGTSGMDAGTYTVRVMVGDDVDNGTVSIIIVVEPEDAAVTFHSGNPVAVQVEAPGGDSGSFQLIVHAKERYPDVGDGVQPGDIALATAGVQLVPVGPGTPVSPLGCSEAVHDTGYDARLTTTCEFGDAPVNTYMVVVTVNGGYYNAYAEDVLNVYDPSLGYTSGGGSFEWPGTGEVTDFGFTMEYNKKGKNVKGALLLIRHTADGEIYRVKSNALYGLSLGEDTGAPMGWASFSGKTTYKEPGWVDAIGNHEFVVYVEDRNDPGSGIDRFWIELKDKGGQVIAVMSIERPAETHAVDLQDGYIMVPH